MSTSTQGSWARQLAKRSLATLVPRRRLLVRGPASGQKVCITFDDGPHADHTPRVLDILAALGVRATFFVVGEQARRHPDLVRRIAADGHYVGHHSYNHSPPQATSASQLLDEIERTEDLLEDLLGYRSRTFRPPYGKVTTAKLLRLWRAGQSVVLWNIDPRDYACVDATECIRHFFRRPLNAGDIVLLHDVHPWAAELLPELIDTTRDAGLSFATVSEWTRPRALVRA